MAFENAAIDLSRTRERPQREHGRQVNYVGHRARIGVVVPSTNTSVEYDCQRIIPRGVTWHTTRFMITNTDLSDDEKFVQFLVELRKTIGASIAALMTCKPDHVMMGMSAETFWGGIKGNDGFVDRIQEMVGNFGLTTGANSVIAALEALGVPGNAGKNLAILTPYQPIGDKNVRLFFEDSGYNVKALVGLRCPNANDSIALVPEPRVIELVKQMDSDAIDAIVQVGTNLSTLGIFPTIEKWLGKPVLPINAATIWHALRSCGIRDRFDNLGLLFEDH
jgi:maleate isomerase